MDSFELHTSGLPSQSHVIWRRRICAPADTQQTTESLLLLSETLYNRIETYLWVDSTSNEMRNGIAFRSLLSLMFHVDIYCVVLLIIIYLFDVEIN